LIDSNSIFIKLNRALKALISRGKRHNSHQEKSPNIQFIWPSNRRQLVDNKQLHQIQTNWRSFEYIVDDRRRVLSVMYIWRPLTSTLQQSRPSFSESRRAMRKVTDQPLKSGGCRTRPTPRPPLNLLSNDPRLHQQPISKSFIHQFLVYLSNSHLLQISSN